MPSSAPISTDALLVAARRAARRVPAYQVLLSEAGIAPDSLRTSEDLRRLPVLNKHNTFQRFALHELCLDGELGDLASVLTSSGHSGVFAFGLTETGARSATVQWVDDLLDSLFAVRTRRTLLVNCLPMGVKVPTEACTLAETSVRADMVVGIMGAFASHFAQIVLVGEAAFIKHVLELGQAGGITWSDHLVHVIVGEEPLAENARRYLESTLGSPASGRERGHVTSSMGVAEFGLNLFYEAPPLHLLPRLRRVLHEDIELRAAVLGDTTVVPSLFTYDAYRTHVEFDADGRLLLSTLGNVRLPLLRYMTGDRGAFLTIPRGAYPKLQAAGLTPSSLESLRIVAVHGRGDHALAGSVPIYPEEVKEGLYFEHRLVPLTTANFRLTSGPQRARLRVQLSPGTKPTAELVAAFEKAICRYVRAPFELSCEAYEAFGSGMSLDYERKFAYLEQDSRSHQR